MNQHLKDTPDGASALFEYDTAEGRRESVDIARIFWPFALSSDFNLWTNIETWAVTHLPTGMRAADELSLADAESLISELRLSSIDFSFTEPKGNKWRKARIPMRDIVYRYTKQGVQA